MSSQECAPPCRCQFVQQWLEDHAKYFDHPVSKPELPPLATRIANRTFVYQVQNYEYSEAAQIRNRVMNTSYLQPPFNISPVKPSLPVRKYFC